METRSSSKRITNAPRRAGSSSKMTAKSSKGTGSSSKMSTKSSKRAGSSSKMTVSVSSSKRTASQNKDSTNVLVPGAGVHINSLPIEMLCHILSFLLFSRQLKLATVSCHWQQAVNICLTRCRSLSHDVIPALRDVTNEMLEKVLPRLPSLQSLDCRGNTELDIDIVSRHCLQLVKLNLTWFKVDVPSLERLCIGCPKLAELTLPDTSDDACVEAVLRGLPGLRALNLDISEITGRCLALLPAGLQRLQLTGSWNLRAAELDRVARCTALTELHLSDLDGPQTSDLVQLIDMCPQLERLNAKECEIEDGFLKQLPAKTPNIRDLSLEGCCDLTPCGLKNLGRLKELRRLNLFDTDMTDAVLKQLEGAFHLTDIALGTQPHSGPGFSEKSLARLVVSCPSLRLVVLTEMVDPEDLVEHLIGQLSPDRDVTVYTDEDRAFDISVREVEAGRLMLPEDGPLRVVPYPSDEEQWDIF